MIGEDSIHQLRAVVEDLRYLKGEWNQEVQDDSLRRATAQMRRLLVDGDLQQAWRAFGFAGQPIIRAPSLEVQLRGIPLRLVSFAQAGGALYQGLNVEGVMEIAAALSPQQIKERYERTKGGIEREYSLGGLMKAPCIAVRGVEINRHLVVKYVANKLGGVHLDPKRNLSKEEGQKFGLLDSVRDAYEIGGKNAIYFEVLSIGQSLAASPDIERFLEVGKPLVE